MVVDQSEMRSFLLKSMTFERDVENNTIGEVFDETVHPTRDMLDLMDLYGFEDTGGLQMLNVGLAEYAVGCGG